MQQPNLSHPFHLHGYGYSVIGIGRSPDTNVKKINLKHALDLDRRGLLHRQYNLPPTKDTIAVPNNGYVVLRFRADNPGKCCASEELFVYFVQSPNCCCVFFPHVFFFSTTNRLLDVPLPFPLSHCYRNEFNSTSWYSSRFTTNSARFPNMRRSHATDTNQLNTFDMFFFCIKKKETNLIRKAAYYLLH